MYQYIQIRIHDPNGTKSYNDPVQAIAQKTLLKKLVLIPERSPRPHRFHYNSSEVPSRRDSAQAISQGLLTGIISILATRRGPRLGGRSGDAEQLGL